MDFEIELVDVVMPAALDRSFILHVSLMFSFVLVESVARCRVILPWITPGCGFELILVSEAIDLEISKPKRFYGAEVVPLVGIFIVIPVLIRG
jgi:hypothetical protein